MELDIIIKNPGLIYLFILFFAINTVSQFSPVILQNQQKAIQANGKLETRSTYTKKLF